MAVNGIYIPGWEYNRLLADDPYKPRNSALPGALLWNGAAPLWMFEKVYCTKESLESEKFAAEEVGWATSRIFQQLADGRGRCGGILETVDWQTLNDPRDCLGRIHASLKADDSCQVRRWIDEGNDPALEQVNHTLLQPVAAAHHSIVAGSMGGLRHWLAPQGAPQHPTPEGRHEQIQRLLSLISAPIDNAQPNGLRLLRHPRDWDPGALARQEQAKERVETPFIRDLQAGEGDFEGANGFQPYLRNVATEKAVYQGVDAPLFSDWKNNLDRLLKLREAAEKHLWPNLHGEWLPALLENDPKTFKKFPHYVKDALRYSPIGELLNLTTTQVIGLASAAIGAAATYDPELQDVAAYVSAGGATAVVIDKIGERRMAPNAGPLAVFYQEAFRVFRH
ncbi:hypothetical protein ABT144_18430 [Streptomyces sp. NPDC002039]|uniref:hypothetical protein n=1 Tax=Streptomyces sp. NPDC002039 TaxID=3154660 RepID=UPI00332ADC93